MGPLVLAWAVGQGLAIYNLTANRGKNRTKNLSSTPTRIPPSPRQLLMTSGVFVLLGIAAQNQKIRPVAVLAAWGFDVAAFMVAVTPTTTVNYTTVAWPPNQLPDSIILPGQSIPTSSTEYGSDTSSTTPDNSGTVST
jgi:hypothetical protein